MPQPIALGTNEQPSCATTMDDIQFDITNVSITDLCAVDDHLLNVHDDILNGDLGQFDLANYVDGGSSSLLLSPPPVVRQRTPMRATPTVKALVALSRSDVHKEEDDSITPRELQNSNVNTQPMAIAATSDNGNRRKRRNLTKAFIDTTDDSDPDNGATHHKEKMQQTKKQRRKDDDPVWNPVPNGNSKSSGKTKNEVAATPKDTSNATKLDESSKGKRVEKLKVIKFAKYISKYSISK